MAETKVTVGRFMNVEFTLRVPDLSEADGPYLLAEDLGDMIARVVHDLDSDRDQAQAIFANLKHKMNELMLFADNDYPESKKSSWIKGPGFAFDPHSTNHPEAKR